LILARFTTTTSNPEIKRLVAKVVNTLVTATLAQWEFVQSKM